MSRHYSSKSGPIKHISEVFKETEGDEIESKNMNDGRSITQVIADNNPILPKFFDQIDVNAESKTLARSNYYSQLAQFSPYLIKKLLYLTATNRVSDSIQIKAAKILLDKIMPNLEASQVQVDHNVQSLVIVKSTDKDDLK